MPGMAARSYTLIVLLLAGCATVSGLADKQAVDCPGGSCEDGGNTPVIDSGGSSSGQPDSTPPPDAKPNFVKPDGWGLVAVAETTNGGTLPDCPQGLDDVSDIGTSPFPTNTSCECKACTVDQQATCAGNPGLVNGTAGVCDNMVTTNAAGGPYSNSPAGGCNGDMFAGSDRTGQYAKVKLQDPTGGSCTPGSATPHPERVDFSLNRRRVCDDTARCNGSECNATVPAPFTACVASPKGSGDLVCPDGFPQKIVAGAASVSCNSAGCGCTVTRTPCTGTFSYYKDVDCTVGAATITADDTCRNLNATSTYMRYKIVATTQTGCTGNGTSTATVAPTGLRTVCCR